MGDGIGINGIVKYIVGGVVVAMTMAVGSWLIQTTAGNQTRISVVESKLCDITKNQDRMLELQESIREDISNIKR